MPKAPKTTVQITRRGMVIWAVLFFFIAAWMFILGILVGRGTAPVTMDMNRLEKELIELKSALIEKESAQLGDQSEQQKASTTELGFYEALKQVKPANDFKVDPRRSALKTPEPKREPKPEPPKKSLKKETMERPPARDSAKDDPKPAEPQNRAKPAETEKDSKAAKAPEMVQGGYTIQVAAFQSGANADRMVLKLKKKGFRAYQIQSRSDNGKSELHRVRVGAFKDRPAAEAMLDRLKRQSIKGILVTTP